MKYIFKNQSFRFIRLSVRNPFTFLMAFGMMAVLVAGCSSSTSANGDDENGNSEKETRTFDLMLSADGSTKIGTATTEIITPDDDAYIDEGFFITLDISASDFEPPYEIDMNNNSGVCGTWDVQDGEKAEMPCDYDEFLDNPVDLTVTSEDGDGVEAYPVE